MTIDQITLFTLLFFVFVFLIWGRWRYDVVAFVALLASLLTGIVPTHQAFSGFGHPAVVIIALVLIISRGLTNSGAIELLARYVISGTRKLNAHIAINGEYPVANLMDFIDQFSLGDIQSKSHDRYRFETGPGCRNG